MSSATSQGSSRDIVFAVPARKTTMGAPTTIPSKTPKDKTDSKQHKRSRSGCFTCRLRRKKCDEAKGACRACKHLGLKCEYKRPQWWGNSEERRHHKDFIKDVIKRTQLAKKTAQNMSHSQSIGSSTPPGLCHSISTPEGFSDSVIGSYTHSRAQSIDQSPLVTDPSYHTLSPESYFPIPPHHHVGPPPHYAMFSPYEVEYKTERQIFINDVPTRRDSTISTFSSYHPTPMLPIEQSPAPESWTSQDYLHSSAEPLTDDSLNFDFFDLPQDQMTPALESMVDVGEHDRPLLEHFVSRTSRVLFPVLDAVQAGSARSGIILPALDANSSFRHSCLSISGTHKKTIQGHSDADLDAAIMRHRYTTIEELCNELSKDENHDQILETTLGLMYFPSCVGGVDDALPDIPWHHHLSSAKALAETLHMPSMLLNGTMGPDGQSAFPMTLTAWIDILGATMRGKSPVFADLYRELNISKRSIGLQEMMGGDDSLMYLISEIACLEERHSEGMDEVMLCKYIEILGNQISVNEPTSLTPADSIARPQQQLLRNLSAVFRIAARIYLCSMVPGFDVSSQSTIGLVQGLVDAMALLPAGPDGFDRSLAWPLLVAGSASTVGSQFRSMFAGRYAMLCNTGNAGSMGRMNDILSELWSTNDTHFANGGVGRLHWRDIMTAKGWECLLI